MPTARISLIHPPCKNGLTERKQPQTLEYLAPWKLNRGQPSMATVLLFSFPWLIISLPLPHLPRRAKDPEISGNPPISWIGHAGRLYNYILPYSALWTIYRMRPRPKRMRRFFPFVHFLYLFNPDTTLILVLVCVCFVFLQLLKTTNGRPVLSTMRMSNGLGSKVHFFHCLEIPKVFHFRASQN
jgi:hypothetical protein